MKPEIGQKSHRAFTLSREAINVEARTVELAFSSELAYGRGWGVEILDHSPGACDLSRLNDAAPLLCCHDPDEQIGVVEKAWIAPDRRGRCIVRFSRSEDGEKEFQDVIDGIRTKVSVGYTIDELQLVSSADGIDTYRVTKWTPFEVSLVSIPADSTVGVGRAAPGITTEQSKMTQQPELAPVAAPAAPAPTITVDDRATRRLAEVTEIMATGKAYAAHGGHEIAAQAVQEDKSLRWVCDELLKRTTSAASKAGAGEIGMSRAEQKQYSVFRLLRALANPNDANLHRAAAFEMEAHADVSARMGAAPNGGILIPLDVFKRDMTSAGSSGSNYLVATNNQPGGLIELLRNRMVVSQLGAQVLDGLQGNVTIPKLSAASTAYWLSTEATAITESQPTLGQLSLTPKTIGASVDTSRLLMLQSTPSVEQLVMNDLLKIIAIGIDKAALNGAGSGGEPTGVSATSGIGSVSGTSIAYAGIVEFLTDVGTANALADSMAFVTTPAVAGLLKQRQRFSSTDTPLWQGRLTDGTVEGYRAVSTNQIASASMIFGDWSQVLMASWGTIELTTTSSDGDKFKQGITTVKAMASVDIGVRIPAAFSQATSIT